MNIKTKISHSYCLSIIWIAVMTLTEALAMSPETIKSIEHWRTEVLPAAESEQYWATLKELGEKITDADARKIEATGSSDAATALALMAYRVANSPEKVDEIVAWYGRTVDRINQELWDAMKERLAAKGLSERDMQIALSSGWSSPMRSNPPTMRLIQVIHGVEDYLHIWEAWMLSPSSGERNWMRQRMNEALALIGDERTIAILVEKCRVLPEHGFRQANPTQLQEGIRMEAGDFRGTIRSIGGKAAIVGLLECAKIAEVKGFAGEEPNSVRSSIVRSLSSSYNPQQLSDMPEWAESLRDPENPAQLVPWDDKWKEFKPIIEKMLENPGDLSPEDVQTLKAALNAMPN